MTPAVLMLLLCPALVVIAEGTGYFANEPSLSIHDDMGSVDMPDHDFDGSSITLNGIEEVKRYLGSAMRLRNKKNMGSAMRLRGKKNMASAMRLRGKKNMGSAMRLRLKRHIGMPWRWQAPEYKRSNNIPYEFDSYFDPDEFDRDENHEEESVESLIKRHLGAAVRFGRRQQHRDENFWPSRHSQNKRYFGSAMRFRSMARHMFHHRY